MKRILSAVTLFAVVTALCVQPAGAETWRVGLTASYPGISFNDVHFLTPTMGWTVGSKGLVLKTTDGGATWAGTTNDTLGTLSSVYLRTATDGYIGGSSRKLYKTTDGGASWTRILLHAFVADTGAVVRGVYFADASKGWILTTLSSKNGRILHTTDGGTTWTEDLVVAASNMIDMYFSGPDRGVAVGKNTGTLYYTKNGTTWTAAPAPVLSGATYTRSDIRGIHMVDSLLGYAVGWGSLVGAQPSIQLRTTNGGETWAQQVQDAGNRLYDNLYGVYFKNAASGLCLGGATRGSIAARTADSGKTWTPIDLPCGATLNSISGMGDTVVVGGASGVLFRSTDFGSSWELKTGMPSATISALSFVPTSTGYGAGFDGVIVKTTDNGGSWKASFGYANRLSPNFNDVFFLDATTGFAVGSYRVALKTTNGGSTWSQVIADTTSATVTFNGAFFVDQNLGFLVGAMSSSNGAIYKTTDGGANWTTKTAVIAKALRDVGFGSATVGAAVGLGKLAVYTTNGGTTWSPSTFNNIPAGRTVAGLRKIAFLSATNAIAVGDTIILKSTDGGANWNYVTSPAAIALNGLAFQDATTGYAVGKNQVLKTTDGGDTWVAITDALLHTDTQNAVGVDGTGNPWVSGASGQMTTTGTPSEVEADGVLPARFALDQNYPNPFNPSTTVTFSLPQASRVELAVYNLLGQRIATPVDGKMFEAGNHTVRFDARSLATGVYLYRLTAGVFTETRKMVLVK